MNKKLLRLPTDHYWILNKNDKLNLLAELKRRVEVLS